MAEKLVEFHLFLSDRQHRRSRREHDGPRAHRPGPQQGIAQRHPLCERHVDELDQQNRVPNGDAGECDHADHRRRREEDRIGIAPHRPARERIQQPESRHDSDQCQRDGDHQDQRHGVAPRLVDEEQVDSEHGRPEGDAEVAEDVQRDLPLALSRPDRAGSGRQPPGLAAAVREVAALREGPRLGCAFCSRRRLSLAEIGADVHDGLGGRATHGLRVHVGHPLEVLVVDGLLGGKRLQPPQLTCAHQRYGGVYQPAPLPHLGDAGPSLEGDGLQGLFARAPVAGQAQADRKWVHLFGNVKLRGVQPAQGQARGCLHVFGRDPG